MARRSLPEIDPTLDLTGHLKWFQDLPNPWDAAGLFGRRAPLEIEVGSGKGLFLRSTAPGRPETDFLGIEIAGKYARFAAAQLARRNLSNVLVANCDALRVFRELLPSSSLQAVHVYFPDPWWKARHKKRRVMNESFLADVERTLQAGGALHFWTDVEEYFQSSLELIARTGLAGPLDVPEAAPQHELDYRTHFERRMRLHTLPVFRSEFRKG
jgi:tRNA (guanine-N7-)-methyltransferase